MVSPKEGKALIREALASHPGAKVEVFTFNPKKEREQGAYANPFSGTIDYSEPRPISTAPKTLKPGVSVTPLRAA